jgi:trehalose 6-phosphate synthase/phosphatase
MGSSGASGSVSVCGAAPVRIIIASNILPLRTKPRHPSGWHFEWDEDALVAQAKDGVPQATFNEVLYVGSLPVDIDIDEQEVRN